MSTISAASHVDMTSVRSRVQAIPWLVWASVVASVSIATGLYWDISWHETIGRDSFWTPAHLLIQFGAIMAALASAWVIMRTTFSSDPTLRQNSVSVLGLRGPLGAFIAAWGGGAMVTSAPFDNWWHEAYGLDVKIISPPHILLALGIAGIMWGGAILAVTEFNRATDDAHRKKLNRILLLLGGFVIVHSMTLKLEYTNRVLLHSGISYLVISTGTLFLLEAMSRASGHRWARTIITGVYSAFVLILLWVLPLFPAQPKLGPVYQNITHMVPLPFPMLLIVPAFILDLFWPWLGEPPTWGKLSRTVLGALGCAFLFLPFVLTFRLGMTWISGFLLALPLLFLVLDLALNVLFQQERKPWNKWLLATFAGLTFLAVLIVVEWPFATFLMSQAARNWFFAPYDFPYFALPTSPTVRHLFVHWEGSALELWRNMALAFAISVVSTRIGITFGNWLRSVRR